MKKIYSLATLLLLTTAAYAQRSIDLQTTMLQPTSGQTVTVGQAFTVAVEFKNLGPNPIQAGDTLLYTYTGAGGSVYYRVIQSTKNVNDTLLFQSNQFNFTAATNGSLNFCFAGAIVNRANPIVDNDTTNDASCKSITITGGSWPSSVPQVVDNGSKVVENLNIAPNPAVNNISLDFVANSTEEVRARVVDITGRTVISQSFGKAYAGKNDFNLDVTNLTSGMYFVEISQGTRMAKGKLIKQ